MNTEKQRIKKEGMGFSENTEEKVKTMMVKGASHDINKDTSRNYFI